MYVGNTDEFGNESQAYVGFSNLEPVKNPGVLQARPSIGRANQRPKVVCKDRQFGTWKGMVRRRPVQTKDNKLL